MILKKLRKMVPLTDTQSRKLNELSEFDGLDPVVHAMRAIDEYLKKQNLHVRQLQQSEIKVSFKTIYGEANLPGAFWLSGLVDHYEFSALVLKLPSKSGIDKGNISKLSIWDPVVMENTNSFIQSCIVNYDRGWDIKPSKIAEPYYNKVKTLLDSSAEQYIKRRFRR